jgi:hypothetical protein
MRTRTTSGAALAIFTVALAGALEATRAEAQGGPRRWRGRPETQAKQILKRYGL